MSHRLQITLTNAQYERLRQESSITGASLAELTRTAVDKIYTPLAPLEQRIEWLEEGAGAWVNRSNESDPYEEWRRLRPPMGPLPE